MSATVGNFMLKNLQKEAKTIVNPDHLKLISDFNVPLHKYNKLATEDAKTDFIIEHMISHMKHLIN